MKLRTKLLALSLLTLLLPWSAWKLLQELEQFLRDSQEGALLASARSMAAVIPLGFQTRLQFLPERFMLLRDLHRAPQLDGYRDDWPGADQGQVFESADGSLSVRLLAGEHEDRLFLLFDVSNALGGNVVSGVTRSGELKLALRNPRGLFRFTIAPQAPGPIHLRGEEGAGQIEGFWLDRVDGYRIELALPVRASGTDVSFGFSMAGAPGAHSSASAGPLAAHGIPRWVSLVSEWQAVSDWLARSDVASARSWLVSPDGWVLADSRKETEPLAAEQGTQETTWAQRSLYRLVAGSRMLRLDEPWPPEPLFLDDDVVRRALAGREASGWTQDNEDAVVRNTVAVPIMLGSVSGPGSEQGRVYGALVMQSTSEGLLLMTNRALGRLLFTTLALSLGLAAALWFFATRLSRRVQRLGGAVSRAMEDGVDLESLPLVNDRDELGELARNNEKLLRAVADYSQYLQTLASKLSHELKTPLAITRSSLDNLSSRGLDEESGRFLARAQEGVDRQTAIVRAMSEASRLEAAIGVAEWAEVDLCGLLRRLFEGYRSVHPGRRIELRLPEGEQKLRCAPDLLAQALDKLVDNAVSLSGPEDVVTLILKRRDGACELAVRNSGSRLPEALKERLFDSLVSVRDKRGAGPHLGLGLYIVRLVAAAHGGKALAHNLPANQGVEFSIRLPAQPGA